jgi:hypothetical protein
VLQLMQQPIRTNSNDGETYLLKKATSLHWICQRPLGQISLRLP